MKKHLNEVKRLQKIAGILKENTNEVRMWFNKDGDYVEYRPEDDTAPDYDDEEDEDELPPINKAELVSFIRQAGPKPTGAAPKGKFNVSLIYNDYPSIPDSYMTGARDVFMCVVKACGGKAVLQGQPGPEQMYSVMGCSFDDINAVWQFLASDETYSVDTPTTTQANGCAQTWQIEMSGTLKENIGKKITVTTASGTQEYTEADIQDMIDNLDSYMQSDNLPKWMYLASFHNARFPRTKKDILNVLNKILASEKDVYINVKSDQPPQMMTPGVSKK